MSPEAELAAVGVGGSGVTLLLTEAFRRFRSRHDARKSDAEVKALEAEGDARILGAATAAFTALTERMDADISDLRTRLRRVEDEVIALRTEKEYLIQERDQLREENKGLHARVDQLSGELRQTQQLLASGSRVFGQEGDEDDDVPA